MNASAQHHLQMMGVGVVLVSLFCMGCSQDGDPASAVESDTAGQSDNAVGSGTVAQPDPVEESDSSETDIVPASEIPAVEPDAVTSRSITLEPGNWQDVQVRVAESAGKVVVVDLWSTSCLPCITELPHLGQLQRTHPDDVVCISLSVDYLGIKSKPPEYYREKVELVLDKCESDVLNYLCTTDVDTVFDELKLASIPAVYVYGADGELAQRFDSSMMSEDSEDEEPFTYEADIVPLVERLIAAAK